MSERMFPDLDVSKLKLPEELSKHNNYYDPAQARTRYELEKQERKERYALDKVIGKRRKNGVALKKKLKPRHLHMIAMHVNGVSSVEIARTFDVSHFTVTQLLQDPLAKYYIDQFAEGHKADFNALFAKVNEGLTDALDSGDISTRLKGIDRWTKLHRVVNGDNSGESAAEKVKEVHAARFRFLEKVKEIAQMEGVIEAEVIMETSGVADT